MPFLTLDSVTVRVRADTFDGSPITIGLDERGANGSLFIDEVAQTDDFGGVIRVREPVEGEALEGLLRGLGETWSFDGTDLGSRGSGPTAGSAYTVGTAGKFDGKVTVTSGGKFEVEVSDAQPWTVDVWRFETIADDGAAADAWYHYMVVCTGGAMGIGANPSNCTQYRDGVAGSHGVGDWMDAAGDGKFSILGRHSGGAAGAKDYSQLVFRPHTCPAVFASDRSSATVEDAGLPEVLMGGDCVEEDPFAVRARAVRSTRRVLGVNGTKYNNARIIQFRLMRVEPRG